jgi:hypothetical protein
MLRRFLPTLALVALVAALVSAVPIAHAKKTNASAAAGFVEDAQNKDGGFPSKHGKGSDPTASLWASVALLAARKNPRDEYIKNGHSAEQYLVAHKSDYDSLEELGLLTMIQSGGRLPPTPFGKPANKLRGKLTSDAVRNDGSGAALAIFGLMTEGTTPSKQVAAAAAQTLLHSRTADGAWGRNGNADSSATALVLQALVKTGAAGSASSEVKSGLAYLHKAQGNDGSIVRDTRVNKAINGGSVAATAFTQQAIVALGIPAGQLATQGGKTVKQGLVQFQRDTGGLSSQGGFQNTTIAPSVVETAQAFPAFDGKTFPLSAVAASTKGPPTSRSGAKGNDNSSNRVSQGTADQGLSGADSGAISDPGAFAGGSADGNNKPSADAGGSGKSASDLAKGAAGTSVTGTVVGTGPKLAAKAGASDTGLTNQQRATIGLVSLMALLFILGAVLERQRPDAAGAGAGVIAAGRPVLRGAGKVTGITATRQGESLPPRRRWPLVAMLVVGAGLIAVVPLTKMTERAPKGADMISAFDPYMQPERVRSFQSDVKDISAYAAELDQQIPALLYPKATSPAAAHQQMLENNSSVAIFAQQSDRVVATFNDLIGKIHRNEDNYQAVASLPSFKLFPWFFLIPGALLAMLAVAGLLFGRVAWLPLRRAALAVGVGLIIAPIVFQLYTRAPKGDDMVKDFQSIENRQKVQEVQGDFSTITIGHGAITDEITPALTKQGLDQKAIAQQLPGTSNLDAHWVKILNNMTPMIGVMNDNVANYTAIAALPPFTDFMWLFLIPGLLIVALVLFAGTRPREEKKSEVRASQPELEQGAT